MNHGVKVQEKNKLPLNGTEKSISLKAISGPSKQFTCLLQVFGEQEQGETAVFTPQGWVMQKQ
jgi:hypothetical protein